MSKALRVIISGGGTGGHIFPAISIANAIKALQPDASILFIGPSDMIRMTDGEWETYPLVPYMDRLLQKMAQEEHIAYFSLFQWMGGVGSMAHWQEIGLAGKDGIHFMRSGARKAGNAVADWIIEGIKN